eukprot:CAMPEP_0182439160 /NCGR_PEP_ID=MMETSP1167-20130531/86267_1 /TAXON_ID=2988 /ORGANISM="Mallomonas Sp, Strain CCMP3275" /LENGTH=686 /DNA_ID=CAMNT_0024632797 /DNA_START=16 /DNA_END=2073 /DNA_ORIENTATION=+
MSFFDSWGTLLGNTVQSATSGSSSSHDSALHARRNLLISLKDCIFKLTPHLHHSDTGSGQLDENAPPASALCSALEQCLLHGIKLKEFHGILPFWGLLERLESLTPPSMVIRNSVGAIACIPSLHTPLAKARGWIRQILNNRGLEDAITAIKQQQKLVSTFYNHDAIMCHQEDVTALLAIVRSLKVYNFNFTVDSDVLNNHPDWFQTVLNNQLQPMIQESNRRSNLNQTSTSKHTSSTGNYGNRSRATSHATSTSSGNEENTTMDSLLSLFEQGFDVVIDKVDAAATLAAKFISEKIENAETARILTEHFPTLRWRTPFFGSALKALILDESRCSYARLEPRLGVPIQANSLLKFVEEHITTEGLFRMRGSFMEMQSLREILEQGGDVPVDTSPHIAVQCLLQWLYDLEEPLLGYEHYEAIQSCMSLENETDRVRNLSLLVVEAPWWHLPLLLRVMTILDQACLPEHVQFNGLNIVAVAVVATPLLMRPRPAGSALYARSRSLGQCVERDPDERDREHLAAAAAGSTVVELLISRQKEIFAPLRHHLQQISDAFMAKCTRVKHLQQILEVGLDLPSSVSSVSTVGSEDKLTALSVSKRERMEQQFLLVCQLWIKLESVESRRISLLKQQPEPIPATFTVEDGEEEEEKERERDGIATSATEGDMSNNNMLTDDNNSNNNKEEKEKE